MHLVNSSDNASAPRPSAFGILPPHTTSTTPDLREIVRGNDWTARMIKDLCDLIGGIDALQDLDAIPLPNAGFDWAVVADADRTVVTEVLAEIDQRVAHWFGDEYQVVAHRLLARLAAHNPSSLYRGTAVRTAAAITWLALRGNDALGGRRRPTASTVWAVFRVSNCADRGRGLFKAIGLAPRLYSKSLFDNHSDVWLGDPSLLHSQTRASLLRRREIAIAAIEQDAVRRAEAHPLKRMADGNLLISARSVTPRWAIRAPNSAGRELVLATFGESEDEPEVLALSISDARHLVALLENALGSPMLTVH
jgi:hypothetical protein